MALFLAVPVFAAPPTPREEVLRLVPDDMAVCLVVQGLRDRATTIAASPFAAWATGKLAPKVAGSDDMKQLQSVSKFLDEFFTTNLGISANELRDDIVGDIIVLAYKPGPTGKPEQEQGVILLKSRDAKKLETLIAKLNFLQKSLKEVTEVAEQTHKNATYFKRTKRDGPPEFYYLRDGLFAFAAQENALLAVLDKEIAPTPTEPSAIITSLKTLGAENAFLTLWVNPRTLDADLTNSIPSAGTPTDKAAREQFLKLWKAVDTAAVTLKVDENLELGISFAYRAETLPVQLKSLFTLAPMRAAVWQSIPDDALFAIAGRGDVLNALDVIGFFLPEADRVKMRKQLDDAIGPVVGKAKLPAVLAAIGPEWGVWATPPSKAEVLPTLTAVVRVRPEPEASIPAAVMRVVNFYVQAVQVEYNKTHADQIESSDDGDIRFLTNEKTFPQGLQPAYAYHDGYLIFGSHPQAVRSFAAPSKADASSSEVPIARVSATAIRRYLGTHTGQLSKWLATVQNRTVEEVKKEFDTVSDVLEAFDRIDIVIRGDGSKATVALKLKMVQPLAK